ncbi:MAG: polyhydroxyalkanoic acid system family protein [Thiohalocapsa sp.]
MAKIHIERSHTLGRDKARVEVEKLAESFESELQANYRWDGDQLLFECPGASGTIDVGNDYIELDLKLSLLLTPMKKKIRDSIEDRLDQTLPDVG